MKTQDLIQFVKNLETVDFEFTHIGEYIFTNMSEKYPLCSLWEFSQMKYLPHAKDYLNQPIDYSTFKCLVYDVRGVYPNWGNRG